MSHLRKVAALIATSACLLLGSALPAAAETVTLTASGSGAQEVPPAGGATTSASFTLDTTTGAITYQVTFKGSEPAAAGHIHKAAAGSNGDVVVPLDAAVINAGGTGTAMADPALVADIAANPANYYVNVHTAGNPAGAARGQLSAGKSAAPSAVNAGTGGQFAAQQGTGLMVGLVLGVGLVVAGTAGVIAIRRRDS